MKLIDKDALVAEIGKRRKNWWYGSSIEAKYKREECDDILSLIDNLEVKEVDLEDAKKEELAQKYVDYTFKRHNIDANSKEGLLIYYAFMHGMNKCLTQLRVQKGE